ncbi:hypothetical protein MXB_3005 [Myxobolus squamalis]|nr:hypothetical protein MXB_3005 [Myxobolus squamalis]
MISTPGSLEAILLNSGSRDATVRDLFISSFQYIEILIVDEADKLLEMGFSRHYIPRQRRTLSIFKGSLFCIRFSRHSKTFLGMGILLCSDLLSRGVDIPQVDWVVQYEPPRKSNTFVHRSGRTARLGTAGNCLTFLYPTEIDYVHFLNINKGIKLKPFTFDSSLSLSDRIKKFASKDRDVYLKGLKAYVSFVNFYTQHECKRIFDIKNLELGKIASDFGLLHLPNMPELEDADLSGFSKSLQDHSTIRFKSKVREKLRQKIIKKKAFEKLM